MGGTNEHQETIMLHLRVLKQMQNITIERVEEMLLRMEFGLMFVSDSSAASG